MLSSIKNGESEQLEFKASFGREVIETLSAFANTKGGAVLIGVGDEGKITGVQVGHETVQQWVNQTKNSTSPAVIPDVEIISHRGKTIVVLSVVPYPIMDDPLTVLKKFELLRETSITFGCFLLFCKEPSMMTTIDAGRFDSEIIIRDSITIRADLFCEVDSVMEFVKKHISKRMIITGKAQRDEGWEYPIEAVREIAINMIVHRDYRASADSTIKIFADRIEFFNPGGLPHGICIQDILSGKIASNPRNKQIASIFKEAGIIGVYK